MSASLIPLLIQPGTEVNDMASQISTNTGVMARMISDLLDYTRTRLGAGMPVSPATMDLGVLCQEIYSEFQSSHPNRKIRLLAKGDMRGHWDTDRLRQAISNLLGNAIQHSPESGTVELRLSGEEPEIVLAVHNGGPPIPPGELAKIFEPLVRGSSANSPPKNRPGSIGLGLYIARAIITSHGGTITVTSSIEAGTEFSVCLPREFLVHSGQPILDEAHVKTM
jgi:signal transduction histidine kinase